MPTHANSAGGLFSIDTLDRSAGLARGDAGAGGDLVLRGGNDLRGAFSTAGGAYAATRGVLDGTLPAGGGTLDLRAISASAIGVERGGVFRLVRRAGARVDASARR